MKALTEEQLTEITGITGDKIATLRGQGLPFIKDKGAFFYLPKEALLWIVDNYIGSKDKLNNHNVVTRAYKKGFNPNDF